jgi:hypothetical protein
LRGGSVRIIDLTIELADGAQTHPAVRAVC